MGIRIKLVLCLLAVLLPLVATSALAIILASNQMTQRTKTSLKSTQRLEAARIEQILDGYSQSAKRLAAGPHVRQFAHKLHEARSPRRAIENTKAELIPGSDGFLAVDPLSALPLKQLAIALQNKAKTMDSAITELRLLDVNGNTLGETSGFSWNILDEGLIARSINTGQTLFGNAFLHPDDESRLGMVTPILSLDDRIVGALVMESRLNPIIDLLSEYEEMGKSMEAHLAQATPEGDAQFITPLRFDRTAAFRKQIPGSWDRPINNALKSVESRVIKGFDYRGTESYMAYQTIKATGWGLVVKMDVTEANEPMDRLCNLLILATVASVCFVILIYLFILGPVANRLKDAARAANEIMDGNLSSKLVHDSNDEIADLSESINLLAHDLGIDQKKRAEIEAKLRHQALHDDLTGILNRAHANKVIDQLSEDQHRNHSIAFLDLNGFKEVNDRHGHAIGDEVLVCVAQRLVSTIPQGCTLARWGGDEFVIIMPGVDGYDATEFAMSLNALFKHPIQSSEGFHNVSCSVGLATSNEDRTLSSALREADALMYEQKKLRQCELPEEAQTETNIAKKTLLKKHKRKGKSRSPVHRYVRLSNDKNTITMLTALSNSS